MQNYSSIIGLPIILGNKKKIAVVNDVLYCSKTKTILGLIINGKGLISKYKYIPLDEIEKVNPTNIIIKNATSIKTIENNSQAYEVAINPNKCTIDSLVYSQDKVRIGKIKDIIFNFEAGIIDGYIITDGITEDIVNGRKVINDNLTVHNKKKLIIKEKGNDTRREWIICITDLPEE